MRCTPIPIRSDNYAWLLGCEETGALAVVDPAEPDTVIRAIEAATAEGATLGLVLLTHHHDDHIAGARRVADRFGARLVGAAADRARLPPLDVEVAGGDTVRVGATAGTVIETPGHTVGHVSYFFDEPAGRDPVLACGDTLFSLGCGRLFEGTPKMMFESLRTLAGLPARTLVACGHEYTEANARFARSVSPDDATLAAREAEIGRQRAAGRPTVPSRLGDETACNPFLRAADADAFAALRAAKDRAG